MNNYTPEWLETTSLIPRLLNENNIEIISNRVYANSVALEDYLEKIISCKISKVDDIAIIKVNGAYICHYHPSRKQWMALPQYRVNDFLTETAKREPTERYVYKVNKSIIFNLLITPEKLN